MQQFSCELILDMINAISILILRIYCELQQVVLWF
jgi:hypothetical protein